MAKIKTMPGTIGFQVLAMAQEPVTFKGDDGVDQTFQQFDFYGGYVRVFRPQQIYSVGQFLRLGGLVGVKAGTLVKLNPTVFEPVDSPDVTEYEQGALWSCLTYGQKDVYTKGTQDFLSVRLTISGGIVEIRDVRADLFKAIDPTRRLQYAGRVKPNSRYNKEAGTFDLTYSLMVDSVNG